jgi:hypothetical protein
MFIGGLLMFSSFIIKLLNYKIIKMRKPEANFF